MLLTWVGAPRSTWSQDGSGSPRPWAQRVVRSPSTARARDVRFGVRGDCDGFADGDPGLGGSGDRGGRAGWGGVEVRVAGDDGVAVGGACGEAVDAELVEGRGRDALTVLVDDVAGHADVVCAGRPGQVDRGREQDVRGRLGQGGRRLLVVGDRGGLSVRLDLVDAAAVEVRADDGQPEIPASYLGGRVVVRLGGRGRRVVLEHRPVVTVGGDLELVAVAVRQLEGGDHTRQVVLRAEVDLEPGGIGETEALGPSRGELAVCRSRREVRFGVRGDGDVLA